MHAPVLAFSTCVQTSALKNEKQSVFDLFSVLDVYREKDGRYQFSFYVPKQHNRPVSSFRVDKKTLYAICDQYISLYELSF